MDNVQLAASLSALAPDLMPVQGKQFTELTVAPDRVKSLVSSLKADSNLSFDMLVSLTGIDWGAELGVIYHLRSTAFNHMLVVKARIADRDNPVIDSICSVYSGAEFHEREAYDLLGIRFSGHPDLRRLFLDSTWGYPLRKDYKDDVNIVSK